LKTIDFHRINNISNSNSIKNLLNHGKCGIFLA
jgi:hypothetical protein